MEINIDEFEKSLEGVYNLVGRSDIIILTYSEWFLMFQDKIQPYGYSPHYPTKIQKILSEMYWLWIRDNKINCYWVGMHNRIVGSNIKITPSTYEDDPIDITTIYVNESKIRDIKLSKIGI